MSTHRKTLASSFLAIICASSCGATTIVFEVQKDCIILVADSRRLVSSINGLEDVRDDECKLANLGGKFGFAETGREGYDPANLGDSVPEFHGTSEAVRTYKDLPDRDLLRVAERWAVQLRELFGSFYRADSSRLRSLAIRPQKDLLTGLFAGQDAYGYMKIYMVRLAISDDKAIALGQAPISYAIYPFPREQNPITLYSTNPVTNELLEGKTDRAAAVGKLWKPEGRKIKPLNQEVQRLEFFAERTGDYDPEVHSPINALLITRQGIKWIENSTCRK